MSDGVTWFRKIMKQCNTSMILIEHQFRDKDGNTCWHQKAGVVPTFFVRLGRIDFDVAYGSLLKTDPVRHGSAIKFDETDSSFREIFRIKDSELDKYSDILDSIFLQCLALSAKGFNIYIQPGHENIKLISKDNPYAVLMELDLEDDPNNS